MDIVRENTFHGVSVGYKPGSVHIRTDSALMSYLGEEGNGSLALSAYIHRRYLTLVGQALDISEDSLAVEILIHAYLDTAFRSGKRLMDKLPGEAGRAMAELFERLQERTDVIDCGERSVDGNRAAFDVLAPFHGIIYGVLGRRA